MDSDANHWGLKSREDWQGALKFFLERAEEMGNNQEHEYNVQKNQHLGEFCSEFLNHLGVSELKQAIHGVLGPSITVPQLVSFLDALRGPSSISFPVDHISPLLSELNIDWNSMTGDDLGELLSSLLLFAKAQSSPEQVGRVLAHIFSRASYNPTAELTAAAIRYLWEEGFAWGRVPGALLSHLLDDRWKLAHFPDLVCCLVQGCLDSEELDLLDFDSLDAAESDAHNPAVRIGLLLDEARLPNGCELALCSNMVRAFLASFGAANCSNGSEAGPNVHPPRADIFIARVLQQLSFAHETTDCDTGNSVKCWRVSAAIGLACSLCAGPNNSKEYDWRLDRKQHAYCVGEILRGLRQDWSASDTSMLVAALRIPPSSAAAAAAGFTSSSTPSQAAASTGLGCGPQAPGSDTNNNNTSKDQLTLSQDQPPIAPPVHSPISRSCSTGVPNRIIAEVCEGLGAPWDVVIMGVNMGMGMELGFQTRVGGDLPENEDRMNE